MISSNARFAVLAILLACAAVFLHTRTRQELLPPGPPLSSLPLQFAGWTGADMPFSSRTLAVLGPGEYVMRQYQGPPANGGVNVDLFLAHRLRANRQVLDSHLPTECLVGSGWSLDDSGNSALSVPGQPGFTANRYVVTRGSERQLVLFWFWAHGRSVASENWTDFYLTLDSFLTNRKDYFLVRINTPLQPGEEAGDAQQRLFSFATQLNRLLDRYSSS